MEVALNSRARKTAFLGAAVLITGLFFTASTIRFATERFAQAGEHLQLATRLEPGNAHYHALLGRRLLRSDTNLPGALQQYRLAAFLNPYDASHWLAIADTEQLLNNVPGQLYALRRAIDAAPTSPQVAWAAANFFLARGAKDNALQELKVVLQGQPGTEVRIFELSSRVADVSDIIHKVLPPNPLVYLSFLTFLTAQKNSAGAAQAWDGLVDLGKPFAAEGALAYVDYLLSQHEVAAARRAWRQSAALCGLAAYLPSGENLIVNAGFDSDILNGGFDWHYRPEANVELSLDPGELHDGRRTLSVVFDGPAVADAGIAQYIPVEPQTAYELTARYKAAAMDGAGGPKLEVRDAYTGSQYFSSDDLRLTGAWRAVSGQFKTGPETELVVLHLVRVPAGSPIRGKLWIDGLRLAPTQAEF